MEQNLDCTNIGTWVHDNEDTIYRFLVYKKMFTPKEQKECYCDQDEFTSNEYVFCRITNAIEIPNDVLLELTILDKDGCIGRIVKEYHRLSDIKLFKFNYDNEVDNGD